MRVRLRVTRVRSERDGTLAPACFSRDGRTSPLGTGQTRYHVLVRGGRFFFFGYIAGEGMGGKGMSQGREGKDDVLSVYNGSRMGMADVIVL